MWIPPLLVPVDRSLSCPIRVLCGRSMADVHSWCRRSVPGAIVFMCSLAAYISCGRLQAQSVPTTDLGSTSAAQTATLTIATAGTTGTTVAKAVHVLTQGASGLDFAYDSGGSCAVSRAYAVGQTCTVEFSFTPTHPGTRYGAVQLLTSSGAVLATEFIYGKGIGPQLNFSPATQSLIGSGLNRPFDVAADGNGNVYIVDNNNNRVLKETFASGSYTQTTLASGLSSPQGVAVDGAGNVYITNSSANTVVKETLSAGSYTQSTIISGLDYPVGVAVDGSGDLYVVSRNNNQVLKETLSPSGYSQSTIVIGLNSPEYLAVDGSGNVYIADTDNNRVLKETLSGGNYAQTTIGSGLDAPYGVAVDGVGNVYIADTFHHRVLKETVAGSGYQQSTVVTSGLVDPLAVATDGSGNLYIDNFGPSIVDKEDSADAPSFSFVTPTAVGTTDTTDGAMTLTLSNIGNADLTFSTPETGTNPSITEGFTIGGSSTCPQLSSSSSPGTLAPDTSCTDLVSFAPVLTGTFSGFLVTTDNNLNAGLSTQSVALNGPATDATGTTAQRITFPQPASPVSSGASATLTATASSGLAVYYTVSGPATVSGSIVTYIGSGTVVVTANQDGNVSYAAAIAVSHTVSVNVDKSQTKIARITSRTATIDVFGFGFTAPSGTLAFNDITSGGPASGPVTLNTATATTALTSQVTTSTGAHSLPDWTTLGDINGDGKLDLVTSLYQANSVSVQLGNGDGTFQAATTILIAAGFGPAECHLVSLHGNGTLDLIVGSFDVNKIAVLLGNGDGTFQSPVFYTAGSSGNASTSLTTGDFNDDGKVDVAVADNKDNTISIFLGDGSGALSLSGVPILVGGDPGTIRAGDFNGDGYSDLAVANYHSGTVTILLNKQNGTFTTTTLSAGSGADSGPEALAITGSGISLQLAVANYRDNAVSILDSNGDGTFGAQKILAVGKGPDDISFADFNGDGIEDLVVTNFADGTVDLLLGSGAGSFTLVGSFEVGVGPFSAAVGDIDLDGTPDLVVANCFSNNTGVLLDGTQISVSYTGLSMTPSHTLDAVYTPDGSSRYGQSTSAYVNAP